MGPSIGLDAVEKREILHSRKDIFGTEQELYILGTTVVA
jgi:hypothetical protein